MPADAAQTFCRRQVVLVSSAGCMLMQYTCTSKPFAVYRYLEEVQEAGWEQPLGQLQAQAG